ncbi:MAG: hypothetical protein HQL52_10390 [Magnetococcales bacterium]|nr:hypothetical protein [Magnetococcales bacterium]
MESIDPLPKIKKNGAPFFSGAPFFLAVKFSKTGWFAQTGQGARPALNKLQTIISSQDKIPIPGLVYYPAASFPARVPG